MRRTHPPRVCGRGKETGMGWQYKKRCKQQKQKHIKRFFEYRGSVGKSYPYGGKESWQICHPLPHHITS